tara:strand:+ start:990 stop:4097 length:3108 start_codon:yes stop_codon:yes gene_type:complete
MNSKLLIEKISQRLLLEVKKKQFEKDLVDTDIISREEYESKIFNVKRGRPIMPFADANFLQMLYNSCMAKQNHNVQDFIDIFHDVKTHILDPFTAGRKVFVDVPGGERISIKSLDTLTFDEASKFLSAKEELNLSSKRYVECIESQDPKNFEIILNDSEWIVTYPKTILGSISLARSYWDGQQLRYDETFASGKGQNAGVIRWCTSISGSSNMFLNYHRRLNLHMYYCINKKSKSITDIKRKLCISFSKKNNVVKLYSGTATVNARNRIISYHDIIKTLGEQRFNMLEDDASKSYRLEVNMEEYYKSVSLEQYITLREANEENITEFVRELREIIKYSKDKDKIITHALNDKNSNVFECAIANIDLDHEYYINIANSKDEDKVKDIIQDTRHRIGEHSFEKSNSFVAAVLANPSLSDETKAESIKLAPSMEFLKSISQNEYFSNKEIFMQNVASVLNYNFFQAAFSKEEIEDFLENLLVSFKEKKFSIFELYKNNLASKDFTEGCLEWYVDNSDADMSELKNPANVNAIKYISSRKILLKIANKSDNNFANNMIKFQNGKNISLDEEILCILLEKNKNIFKKQDCYGKNNVPLLSSHNESNSYFYANTGKTIEYKEKSYDHNPSERVLNLLLDQQSIDTKFATYIHYAHKFGYEAVYNFLQQNIKTLEKSTSTFAFLCGLTIEKNQNILSRLIVDFCNISEKFKKHIDKNIDKVVSQTNQASIDMFKDSLKEKLTKDYKLSCKLAKDYKPKNENDDILDFVYDTYKDDKRIIKILSGNLFITRYIFDELIKTKKDTGSVRRQFVLKVNCPDEYIINFIKSMKHIDDLRFVFSYTKTSLSPSVLDAAEDFIFKNLKNKDLTPEEKIILLQNYTSFPDVRLEKVFEMYEDIKDIIIPNGHNDLAIQPNIEVLYFLSNSFYSSYLNKVESAESLNDKILQSLNKFLPERAEDLSESTEVWKLEQTFSLITQIETLSEVVLNKIKYYVEEGIRINIIIGGSTLTLRTLGNLKRIASLNNQKQKLTPESVLKQYIRMLLN